jgi:hypothetical protein
MCRASILIDCDICLLYASIYIVFMQLKSKLNPTNTQKKRDHKYSNPMLYSPQERTTPCVV